MSYVSERNRWIEIDLCLALQKRMEQRAATMTTTSGRIHQMHQGWSMHYRHIFSGYYRYTALVRFTSVGI